ncbi:MAG TPA: hypothetical protein DGK91_05830 [Clostridium sp.]|nr:hypothetical protein [Clostridia bacterium]HCW04083.1 hypothetical protein [Clostridium sp.]
MNLNVGVNLAKQMNKLVKRKKMPCHTYNCSNEENGVYTTISKAQCKSENKGILKGKSEYYVLAAGVIGAVAALGIAASAASMGNKKKHFLW